MTWCSDVFRSFLRYPCGIRSGGLCFLGGPFARRTVHGGMNMSPGHDECHLIISFPFAIAPPPSGRRQPRDFADDKSTERFRRKSTTARREREREKKEARVNNDENPWVLFANFAREYLNREDEILPLSFVIENFMSRVALKSSWCFKTKYLVRSRGEETNKVSELSISMSEKCD